MACTIPLFLKPGWELGEGADAEPALLRDLGEELAGRLAGAADALEALLRRGWSASVGLYDVWATKDCRRAEAMNDFLAAGLDPVTLCLEEIDPESPPPQ